MSVDKRVFVPDALKAIAIVLVVLGHFSAARDPWLYYVLKQHFIYLFHMSAFFLVGGYLIGIHRTENSASSWLTWWGRKAKNVLPYYLFLLFIATIEIIFYAETSAIADTLGTLLFMPMYGRSSLLWFLQSYLTLLAVGWLICRYLSIRQVTVVFLFVLPISVWAFTYGQSHEWIRIFSLNSSLINLPFFLLGYLLSDNSIGAGQTLLEKLAESRNIFLVALLVLLLLAWHIISNPSNSALQYGLNKLAITFAVLPVLCRFGAWLESNSVTNRFVRYCSKESILIYATHSLLLFLWHQVASWLGFGLQWFWLQIFGSSAICVAFPALLHHVLTYWPQKASKIAN